MTARLLEGAPLAEHLRADIRREIDVLREHGCHPCLASIQVGSLPGSKTYVASQRRTCEEMGFAFRWESLPDTVSQTGLLHAIERLNEDPSVHGIILQLPIPARLDVHLAQRAINPSKDAEGVHPVNLGLIVYGATQRAPCTAIAAYQLIKSVGVDLYGKEAVVVGHSQIVGKPVSLLLLHDYCTVTTCHVATKDLEHHTANADVVVVACGKPGRVTGSMLKPGAIVIDVGINRIPMLSPEGQPVLNSKGQPRTLVVGDVDFESAREVAGWLTPVPGGVGPLTVMTLLRNVIEAAKSGNGKIQ